MADDLYCSRSDVTKALPLGAITSSGGLTVDSPAGADTVTYDGHGLDTGNPIIVRSTDGGSLPAPLVSGTVYYAIRLSNSAFAMAATALAASQGMQLDLTGSSVSMVVAREPDFEGEIEFWSRWADDCLTGVQTPLKPPIPALVRGLVADLSAKALMNASGQSSAIVDAVELAAKAQLARFAENNRPVRNGTTASANLAVTATLASTLDPRGWGSGRLP